MIDSTPTYNEKSTQVHSSELLQKFEVCKTKTCPYLASKEDHKIVDDDGKHANYLFCNENVGILLPAEIKRIFRSSSIQLNEGWTSTPQSIPGLSRSATIDELLEIFKKIEEPNSTLTSSGNTTKHEELETFEKKDFDLPSTSRRVDPIKEKEDEDDMIGTIENIETRLGKFSLESDRIDKLKKDEHEYPHYLSSKQPGIKQTEEEEEYESSKFLEKDEYAKKGSISTQDQYVKNAEINKTVSSDISLNEESDDSNNIKQFRETYEQYITEGRGSTLQLISGWSRSATTHVLLKMLKESEEPEMTLSSIGKTIEEKALETFEKKDVDLSSTSRRVDTILEKEHEEAMISTIKNKETGLDKISLHSDRIDKLGKDEHEYLHYLYSKQPGIKQTEEEEENESSKFLKKNDYVKKCSISSQDQYVTNAEINKTASSDASVNEESEDSSNIKQSRESYEKYSTESRRSTLQSILRWSRSATTDELLKMLKESEELHSTLSSSRKTKKKKRIRDV